MDKSSKNLINRARDFGGRIEKALSDLLKIDFKNTFKVILLISVFYIIFMLLITYSVSTRDPTEANFTFGFLLIMGIIALVLLIFAAVVRILILRKD